MNRKRSGCIATIVFILLWLLGDVTPGISGGQGQEITRLAELTHWKAGTIVADVGAGDGTYSFEAAQKVGPSGRVYATEIDTEKLKNLRVEVTKRKAENIVIVEGTADDTKLPSSCCDTMTLKSRRSGRAQKRCRCCWTDRLIVAFWICACRT